MACKSVAARFNETALIYRRLDTLLGDKTTLYGNGKVTSLDVLASAYLKYQLVNASQSKETDLLRKNYMKLVNLTDKVLKMSAGELPRFAETKDPGEWLKSNL